MDVRVRPERRLSAEELCSWTAVFDKTLESPSDCKKFKSVNPKGNQSWIFIGRTDAEAEAQILWKLHAKSRLIRKDWCWERLKAGEGNDRGWDGWMASPTQWTWVWAGSRSWWWTGKPGVLQYTGSQSWTWLNDWTELSTLLAIIVSKATQHWSYAGFCGIWEIQLF